MDCFCCCHARPVFKKSITRNRNNKISNTVKYAQKVCRLNHKITYVDLNKQKDWSNLFYCIKLAILCIFALKAVRMSLLCCIQCKQICDTNNLFVYKVFIAINNLCQEVSIIYKQIFLHST